MRRLIIAILAGLIIVGSLFFMRSRGILSSSTIKLDPYIALGQVMAQETGKLLNHGGRIGVVIPKDYQDKSNPVMVKEWDAFRDELRQYHSIELAVTEVISSAELTPEGAMSDARFTELLNKHSELTALVLLVGLPVWESGKKADLPSVRPNIIAVTGQRMFLKSYFTSALVSVLIVPRLSGLNPQLEPKTPREWFDMLYQIYTTQNFASLPDE